MVELNQRRFVHAPPISAQVRKPLGACLIDRGLITQAQLDSALDLGSEQDVALGEILVAKGWVNRQDVMNALADQNHLQFADLTNLSPSEELCSIKPVSFWLEHNVVPWMRVGPILLVATARPDRFAAVREHLNGADFTAVPVLAAPSEIDRAIAATSRQPLRPLPRRA